MSWLLGFKPTGTETYRSDSVTADLVQQGTGNAGRDINNVIINNHHRPKITPSSTIPFRRDDNFIVQDSLDKIHQICGKPASRAALVGLGGVGKSQIAFEYAYQVRDEVPTTWVFWVHAGTQARFEEGYRRIAEATRMDGWDNPKADVLRLARSWLCDESNGRWVIIVDNADDLGVFFPPHGNSHTYAADDTDRVVDSLSNYLPQSPNGSILFTSRSRDVAFRLTGSYTDIVRVDPMNEAHALALVQKKLQGSFDQEDVVALVKELDYMPLAIVQAVAYINQRAPRVTISRYVQSLRKGDKDRAKLLNTDVGDIRRDGKASNSVIATWQISFEYIRRERPPATRLLSLMSLFDRQGIPEALLVGRYQENDNVSSDFEDDLNMLINYCLVSTDVSGSKFEMHRLVQFSTQNWLRNEDMLVHWAERAIMLLKGVFPDDNHQNRSIWRTYLPHARYVLELDLIDKHEKNRLDLASKSGMCLYQDGRWNEAEDLFVQVMETRKRVLGEEHPDTLTSMANMASTYWKQGRWKEAEELEVRVMKIKKRVLGEEHPYTLTSMNNLASIYWNQERWKEAEELEVRVIKIEKRVLGEEHPDTLTSINNLASTYWNQGRWKEAEELQVRVIKITKRVLGEEHPDTLISINNLAAIYRNQDRWKEAEELQVRVMEITKRVLGEEHPDTLTSMNNLASIFKESGKDERAIALMKKCIKGRGEVLGPDHPFTKQSENTLNQWHMELSRGGNSTATGNELLSETVARLYQGISKMFIGASN